MQLIKQVADALSGKAPLSSKRSNRWPTVRKNYLKSNSICAVCASTQQLEVHHVKPFHLHPELELEPTNLITLCESNRNGVSCHQFFGHLGNYKRINPSVREDAAAWLAKLTVESKSH